MSDIYSGTNLRELPGFNIILPAGLISGIPNLIGIIYVLVRTLTRWWVTERSLSMAHRVPFYMSVTELNLLCINYINAGYSAIHGETLQGTACKIAGGVTFFCVTVNMALGGLLSFMTYLRICKKRFYNTGIYDYKFLSIILLISLTLTLIGVNEYGPNKFWCYSAPTDPITPLITIYDNMWIYTVAVVAINFGGVGNAIIYIIYENWTNKYDSSFKTDDSLKNSDGSNNTLVLNSTSGTFKNNQDSYPQIKVHNSVTIEKEIITFSSSNLEISNQE
ncbi:hypothetical protein C2G38_2047099 [Gigaspora rosea]|uniref:G-protein coupled receptors family 1 profile domain-containing protein n=1 Tax=Gigaspora rosea TaxID=44941 RepID=A0A397U722_9GLOM|nr:hypothetical protein C2G38_2047099 [Gigaspora rosea]